MEENKQPNQGATDNANTANPGASGPTMGDNRKAQSTQELLDELNRLGVKFAEVVQSAWESDERKRLEKDVKAGVVSLVNGLERGLRRVGESEQAKEILNKAEDMADSLGERIRSNPASHDMAGSLAKGLRVLAEQIDKLAEELQRKAASSAAQATPKSSTAPSTTPSPADKQDIPITKV